MFLKDISNCLNGARLINIAFSKYIVSLIYILHTNTIKDYLGDLIRNMYFSI